MLADAPQPALRPHPDQDLRAVRQALVRSPPTSTGRCRITAFYNSQGADARRDMGDLLEQFRSRRPDFTYRLLDLDRSPALAGKYRRLELQHRRPRGRRGPGAPARDRRGGDHRRAAQPVSRSKVRTLCFVTGHGERSPEDTDERAGYSGGRQGAVARALRRRCADDASARGRAVALHRRHSRRPVARISCPARPMRCCATCTPAGAC